MVYKGVKYLLLYVLISSCHGSNEPLMPDFENPVNIEIHATPLNEKRFYTLMEYTKRLYLNPIFYNPDSFHLRIWRYPRNQKKVKLIELKTENHQWIAMKYEFDVNMESRGYNGVKESVTYLDSLKTEVIGSEYGWQNLILKLDSLHFFEFKSIEEYDEYVAVSDDDFSYTIEFYRDSLYRFYTMSSIEYYENKIDDLQYFIECTKLLEKELGL